MGPRGVAALAQAQSALPARAVAQTAEPALIQEERFFNEGGRGTTSQLPATVMSGID